MSRPDLDLLLALCGEAEKSDPESLKPVPADMVAVDVPGLRSLIQDAKIGRLAREKEDALRAWSRAPLGRADYESGNAYRSASDVLETALATERAARIDDCGMAEPDQRVRMCRLHSDLRAAVEGLK